VVAGVLPQDRDLKLGLLGALSVNLAGGLGLGPLARRDVGQGPAGGDGQAGGEVGEDVGDKVDDDEDIGENVGDDADLAIPCSPAVSGGGGWSGSWGGAGQPSAGWAGAQAAAGGPSYLEGEGRHGGPRVLPSVPGLALRRQLLLLRLLLQGRWSEQITF
jgi:hypothetical protein